MAKQVEPLDVPTESPEDDDNQLFELTDVKVDTLGLVEQGAVDETFFLLKNQEGAMADKDNIKVTGDETALTPLEQLGAERMQGLIVKGEMVEEMEKATKIGSFLRTQRERRKMSIEDVAGSMPIAGDAIKALENGDNLPSSEILGAFAKVLGVPLRMLQGMMPSKGSVSKADTKRKRPMRKNLTGGAVRGVRSLLSRYGEELPDDIAGLLASLLEDSDDLIEGSENTQKAQDEVSTMAKKEVITDQKKDPAAEVIKTDQQPPPETSPDMVALMARLEKSEKTNQDAITRLEKAESQLTNAREEARQEREARQRIVHIEKAREFTALGVNPDKMGACLHRLSEADAIVNVEKSADAEDRSDLYGYITGVLKAANEQIIETGFYQEVGTVAGVQSNGATLLEKAEAKVKTGEYKDLAEALIHASPEEAQAYLDTVRK